MTFHGQVLSENIMGNMVDGSQRMELGCLFYEYFTHNKKAYKNRTVVAGGYM